MKATRAGGDKKPARTSRKAGRPSRDICCPAGAGFAETESCGAGRQRDGPASNPLAAAIVSRAAEGRDLGPRDRLDFDSSADRQGRASATVESKRIACSAKTRNSAEIGGRHPRALAERREQLAEKRAAKRDGPRAILHGVGPAATCRRALGAIAISREGDWTAEARVRSCRSEGVRIVVMLTGEQLTGPQPHPGAGRAP